MRILPARRRRQGRQQGFRAPTRSFTDATTQHQATEGVDASSSKIAYTGIAPGWLVDPTGRHEHRYWSGSEWTEHVTDGGIPGTDPPPPAARGQSSS
jgi:Protein of unknown function (DUF2510)